jgi:hypothetical protein
MKDSFWMILVGLSFLVISSCSDIKYVKNEITGKAKPAGGIEEMIPPKKDFSAKPEVLRGAVLSVLDSQGYIYEENPSTGTIKTEPKQLSGQRQSGLMGATYAAKLFLKVSGSTLTFNAHFNKKSNLTMGGENLEYPEIENALRKEFFEAVDKELVSK